MTVHALCAICDCDREGNVWPESAESLCAAHWTMAGVRDFVQRGAISDWEPMQAGKHPVMVNHAAMLLTKDERVAASRPLRWQIIILSLCNQRGVWWDDGSGDTRDTDTDRYTALFGLVPDWVLADIETVAREARERRDGNGRAA